MHWPSVAGMLMQRRGSYPFQKSLPASPLPATAATAPPKSLDLFRTSALIARPLMDERKPAAESGITDTGYNAEFDQLQKKLVSLWKSIERLNQDPQTIVVVPSMSIDAIGSGTLMQAFEERFLFLLLLLRQPRARLIYVTSQPILPNIIDYYLDLLPGVIPSHARPRLFLIAPLDGSARPLSDKLLERPRLIERIRSLIIDPDRAHPRPFQYDKSGKGLACAGHSHVQRGPEIFRSAQKRVPQNFH